MADQEIQRPEGIDTAYVAHLARIYLSAEEVAEFQPQLEQVVGYVEKLKELDVSGIAPTSHTQMLSNVLREDGVRVGLTCEQAMANAPESADGQFAVPKIVE
ncbi:MAG: Asp-tRNA(Asn)/Glu-tRNA(Gln) amidotransferase subunit GatC [Lentisphaerae bacterium]|nr:Asp-tRNA(Asn)/Glu-tRNA(Gln) amidotransferase subunit GatC [Lentisphaerota bacterium]